jgi:hypothetical protein
VVDSTKFTDWLKALRELFIDVREVEFVKGIPEGGGVMLGIAHSTLNPS